MYSTSSYSLRVYYYKMPYCISCGTLCPQGVVVRFCPVGRASQPNTAFPSPSTNIPSASESSSEVQLLVSRRTPSTSIRSQQSQEVAVHKSKATVRDREQKRNVLDGHSKYGIDAIEDKPDLQKCTICIFSLASDQDKPLLVANSFQYIQLNPKEEVRSWDSWIRSKADLVEIWRSRSLFGPDALIEEYFRNAWAGVKKGNGLINLGLEDTKSSCVKDLLTYTTNETSAICFVIPVKEIEIDEDSEDQQLLDAGEAKVVKKSKSSDLKALNTQVDEETGREGFDRMIKKEPAILSVREKAKQRQQTKDSLAEALKEVQDEADKDGDAGPEVVENEAIENEVAGDDEDLPSFEDLLPRRSNRMNRGKKDNLD